MINVTPAICTGCAYISMALKGDGTVWAWGIGTLGNNEKRKSNKPVPVSGLTDVTAIATRQALRSNGTVWRWGENKSGYCGDGTKKLRLAPVQVKNLMNVVSIASCLAVREDGTVWAWGWNEYGQLGNGTTKNSRVPIQVHNLDKIKTVAKEGPNYALALRDDGTVWLWGNNLGQMSDDSGTLRLTPMQVPGLEGITAIAAYHHSLALHEDGTVWAWGMNNSGLLGDGTTALRNSPVKVKGLDKVISVSAGAGHSMALREDGTVWTWGANSCGQLGNGIITGVDDGINDCYTINPTPNKVQNLSDIVAISAGTAHSLALKKDGSVWAWGWNMNGELGDGTFYGVDNKKIEAFYGYERCIVSRPIPTQVIATNKKTFFNVNVT